MVPTYTDDRSAPHRHPGAAEDLWAAPPDSSPRTARPGRAPALDDASVVQSREGRYLWLRLELRGDGYASPAVRSIRLHFPRRSYLEYLPAVFAADDDSRWFLERFLSVFQTEWSPWRTRSDVAAVRPGRRPRAVRA